MEKHSDMESMDKINQSEDSTKFKEDASSDRDSLISFEDPIKTLGPISQFLSQQSLIHIPLEEDHLGIENMDIPITPYKIWKALKDKKVAA